MAKDALGAHARDELGIWTPKKRPSKAGISGGQRSVARIKVRNHTASIDRNEGMARRFRTEISPGGLVR